MKKRPKSRTLDARTLKNETGRVNFTNAVIKPALAIRARHKACVSLVVSTLFEFKRQCMCESAMPKSLLYSKEAAEKELVT